MRKLATIQKIQNLEPIPNADRIERATVLGWHVVVKKGDFQVGDYCVYCEIDSVLPEKPEFEFLRPRKFRIKTVRLRGQISQGIAFPISILDGYKDVERKEGLDVAELIGVEKYEPPLPITMGGNVKGSFPGFIPKTDEMRIQSVPDVLTRSENCGKRCYITEKVDGTSVTYYLRDGEFGVCSRNLELRESKFNIHWIVARQYGLEARLRDLNQTIQNVALQAEIIGPKIQKNRYALARPRLMVFNVFDINRYEYLNYEDFVSFTEALDLETVPILRDDYILGQDDVDGLVHKSEGQSVVNPEIHREGIVIRSVVEARDPEIGRLSFKVVNPVFLLSSSEIFGGTRHIPQEEI